MTLTQKETALLKDLKGQEELCIGKYGRYAQEAKSEELRCLFGELKATEESHLKTVTEMMGGTVPSTPTTLSADNCHCCAASYKNEDDKKSDAFLCQDMLASEKHVSSTYNISVFEFSNPAARKMLSHIQAEEQQHGEKIYAYMKANGMYS
jgi:rubrerythrin